MTSQRKMNLTVFMLAPGYHFDSWRMEGSRAEEMGQFGLVRDLTLKAESAKLDAVFFGDVVALGPKPGTIDARTSGFNEPITTLSALSAVTKNIGLVGTMSTTYGDPFITARLLNGLDNLSGGRAGWNVVTSIQGAENFGYEETPSPEERYRRAHEFVSVVQQLWDSWSDDAVVVDRERGVWADIEKIRPINHEGEHFKVMGPLNMRRSPQGRPVLFQAGSSPAGIELGSSIADGIYTAQPRKDESIRFYDDFKQKIAEKGRDPQQVKILPGIMPILGRTMAEAEELAAELARHVHLEQGRARLENWLGMNLSSVDYDEPIPAEMWKEDNEFLSSRYHILRRKAEEGFTLREFIVEQARAEGHHWMIGTPEMVADRMIDWFDAGACDGFNLNPAFMPGGMDLLCDLLVPELQERGYAKAEYVGSTLRENLGLSRPGAWDAR